MSSRVKAGEFCQPNRIHGDILVPNSRDMGVYRKTLAVIAFLFAALASIVYLRSFVRPPVEAAFFLLVFPNLVFCFIAIITGRDANDPKLMIGFSKKAPGWFGQVITLLMVFFVINFVLLLSRGTPIGDGGRPVKKSISGQYQQITRAEYEKLKATENRAFAALWLALNTGLGLTLWFKDYHKKKASAKAR